MVFVFWPRARRAAIVVTATVLWSLAAHAQTPPQDCPLNHDQLVTALKQSVKASGGPDNGGMPVNEWAAVTDRLGNICAVAFSGAKATDQWLGSRAIAVEKANTVVSFSLDTFAMSTANLWAQSQPGGSLFGANTSNPVVAQEIYAGNPGQYGSASDPLVGKHPGGVIAFGGGLALYKDKKLVGGLGASGNTSCADHNIAWRLRKKLGMDQVPDGPTSAHNDAIVYDVVNGKSESGWGHPTCGRNAPDVAKQIGAGITIAQVQEPTGPHTIEGGQPTPSPDNQPPRSTSPDKNTLPGFQR